MLETPEWLPLELDAESGRLTWVRISEAGYRMVSFLDRGIVGPQSSLRQTEWPRPPAGARRDAQYIFHIGNVGSTLISRLLGELPDVFAVREPQLLRQLGSEADFDTVAALFSRTWRPEQRANVKATSFVSELADRLVRPGSKALFLFATPAHYLENILAGDQSGRTLAALSAIRLERLRGRCPGLELDLAGADDGILAALGWATEMTSLGRAAAAMPEGSVMWLDFDLFLTDPVRQFAAIARHFEVDLESDAAVAIAGGPLMERYSKATEHAFGPADRRALLADSRRRNAKAIAGALNWLGGLESRYTAVAEAIRRAQGKA